MIKIEAITLEEAYSQASFKLKCSVTELQTEVVQHPSKGMLGVFKKTAIIVAAKREKHKEEVLEKEILKVEEKEVVEEKVKDIEPESIKEKLEIGQKVENIINRVKSIKKESSKVFKKAEENKKTSKKNRLFTMINDTIMPASFVSTQDEEHEKQDELNSGISDIVKTINEEINALFKLACFEIEEIQVGIYDENTLLIEFNGEDSALLIGKEGYRYKALSYMLFNWINTKYKLQLRLEIAEFLQNQEETVSKYLVGIKENIDQDGRAQTKILDGVLVQIALNELRDTYPDKYVAIRSTRDGLKYIIVNDYHSK